MFIFDCAKLRFTCPPLAGYTYSQRVLASLSGKNSIETGNMDPVGEEIREEKLNEKQVKADPVGRGKEREKRESLFIVCALLCLLYATFTVYWNVQGHEFLNLDDDLYVTENARVRAGLTKGGFLWAFTSAGTSYWHPLTLLSHMMDCEWYGLNPRGHHLNNVLLHLASTLLLFLTLKRMTGRPWSSMGVAAAFALHPISVETVAWVASRKSALSTFFFMLTLWTYVRYTEKPGTARYVVVFLCLGLGLLAKPTLVTLPFVLLLLDLWPLGRLHFARLSPGQEKKTDEMKAWVQGVSTRWILGEKIPLLALSVASVWVSMVTAEDQGILLPERLVPLGLRIQNALVSYLVYIRKLIWPFDLAVFIPYPLRIPLWESVCAGLALAVITVWAIRTFSKRPYITVGWFWFVGTLTPMIGLAQQGLWPAVADRFVYIPQIGLFLMAAWGTGALAAWMRVPRGVQLFLVAAVFLAMMTVSWIQVGYWKNNVTLYTRALEVTGRNFLASMNLGSALAKQNRTREAIRYFHEALESGHLRPEQVHSNLGLAYASVGDKEKALQHYQAAVQINPHDAEAYLHLGLFWLHEKNFEESLKHSLRALEIKQDSEKAHNTIGVALLQQGQQEAAAGHFREALRINPGYVAAKKNLEMTLRSSVSQ
jgi:Tfp pilus assembly protein PilF